MIYLATKKVIQSGSFEHTSMLNKLDMFVLFDRITPDQYTELKDMMDAHQVTA